MDYKQNLFELTQLNQEMSSVNSLHNYQEEGNLKKRLMKKQLSKVMIKHCGLSPSTEGRKKITLGALI